MTDEEWRPVGGHEGVYDISSLGRVWSRPRTDRLGRKRGGVMRTASVGAHGYLYVILTMDGRVSRRSVHSLVLEAFVGPRPRGFDACHRNGVKADNRVENLRWGTHRSNQMDLVSHGVHNNARKTACPQGHPLAWPNLVPGKWEREGRRECRACGAGRAYAKRAGIAFTKDVADRYYERNAVSASHLAALKTKGK